MGSNIIFNLLRNQKTLLVAEGLNVFHAAMPKALVGQSIKESDVRARSGCSIIATRHEGKLTLNPAPSTILAKGEDILLIGTLSAEEKFVEVFGS
jgi:K+/H+ antiporter YhaU regulatory subunit KhtT